MQEVKLEKILGPSREGRWAEEDFSNVREEEEEKEEEDKQSRFYFLYHSVYMCRIFNLLLGHHVTLFWRLSFIQFT